MALPNTFNDNFSRKAVATDVGFKISKPGYDAARTAGNNLIFSSSWPSLPIAFETTISGPFPTTIPHGLNFPPFTMVWAYGPDNSGVGNTTMRFFMPVDKALVYLDGSRLDASSFTFWANKTKLNIKCFNLDLSQDIDYILAPGDTFKMPYDRDFGIKVVKPNKDINSTDMRNYTVHSRCQSPLIQAVKTEATMDPVNNGLTGGPAVQYTNKSKNPVWFYGYAKSSTGKYTYAPYYGQSYPLTATDGFTGYVHYAGGDVGATIIALRDPMFASAQTTVQY